MALTEEDKRELLEEIKKVSIVVEDQPGRMIWPR